MKASAENVFVGATLTKGDEKYVVIKVNAKSMYVAKGITIDDYNRMYSLKPKGTTFKDFCEKNNIEMVKFGGFEIEESEAFHYNKKIYNLLTDLCYLPNIFQQ